MGPPPFSDGNVSSDSRGGSSHLPSMGPPPFSDGNPRGPSRAGSPGRSFNGATAFQRWKRDIVYVTDIDTYILQWGHRLSAMETQLAGG